MAVTEWPPHQNFAWPADVQGVLQGWQCPSCRRVFSPSTGMCSYCPEQPVTSTGAGDEG